MVIVVTQVILLLLLGILMNRNCATSSKKFEEIEIHGYHFHTYFFQTNSESTSEALEFRHAIQSAIDDGFLKNCRLNKFNTVPVGPHTVGSYETCCNKTSISQALSWFMLNRGNLSVLLHPLTRFEIIDHTDRSMFLGQRVPLDTSKLSEDLGDDVDLCLPLSSSPSHSQSIPTKTTLTSKNEVISSV